MTLRIYGYPGCTTVRKAREWAEARGLEVEYAHFSKVTELEERIVEWVGAAGIGAVFNDRAQTFRKLDPAEQQALSQSDVAKIRAMAAEPRFIKRPVATDGNTVLTGFDPASWRKAFA